MGGEINDSAKTSFDNKRGSEVMFKTSVEYARCHRDDQRLKLDALFVAPFIVCVYYRG